MSRHMSRCISPFLTNQREADMTEMALTSAKSNWLDTTSISWIRSALRAPSLHSCTICSSDQREIIIKHIRNLHQQNHRLTLFRVARVIRQRSNSGVPLSSRWKMASTSSGNRVMRCIGNIKKLCMANDWQTGLDSNRRRQSTNCGLLSLYELKWFNIF